MDRGERSRGRWGCECLGIPCIEDLRGVVVVVVVVVRVRVEWSEGAGVLVVVGDG